MPNEAQIIELRRKQQDKESITAVAILFSILFAAFTIWGQRR